MSAQANGLALGVLALLHLHPSNLLQAALYLNRNTFSAGKHYEFSNGMQAAKQHELRLTLKDDSCGISLIQEAKLLSKDTTASSRDFV